ncbi:MAG: glutamine--fructose-6-phosphate transaminase (isomerizing) [Deltaproteobacteria bacterium]|nr:MAG: glutamine--fructose-6-phosphate transaminase (isomerizing) [Deltaproteobacteria bacterium]
MCGIIATVGRNRAIPVLLEGLHRLEYRGYDSAGLAVLDGGRLVLHRKVGRVRELEAQVPAEQPGTVGIAHTRWATHGGVTEANAHPHLDTTGRIAVVHNGIIENMSALRARLEGEGVRFRSETDSEILAHLIGRYYFAEDGSETAGRPVAAVRAALRVVRGTWGIAALFADHPELIVAARNGSPLVIGLGEGQSYLASDSHALVPYTRRVVFLDDGEVARIDASGVQTWHSDGAQVDNAIETLEEVWGDGDKGRYPHLMLKEIHEQPEALSRCLSGRVVSETGTARLGGLDLSPRDLARISRVGLLGCGTAYHACRVGAQLIEAATRVPAKAEIASEFRHRNPVVDPDALFFAVSQSGETADTLGAVKEIQIKGGEVMGVVNVVGSSIARACGRGVYIHSGPEMSVASTKAFSNMVAALAVFTLMLARQRGLSVHDGRAYIQQLLDVPSRVAAYLDEPGPIDELVSWVTAPTTNMVLFLGRGLSAPVAAEGALKLMEVAYIPCIAYPAGEMKHGPIALLEEGSPVIVIAPRDALQDKTLSNLQECKARGARVALIHTAGDPVGRYADLSIPVPDTHPFFSPLLTVLPLQLLAYRAGLALGRDIDRPRNLAKSVTVE